jgi:hypothetical protein
VVAVEELDRLLDREDVGGPLPVDRVDEGGEGRGDARAVGAAHQHEAAPLLGPLGHLVRQAQVVDGGDLGRDEAQHRADAVALHEGRHPEAPLARDGV